MTMTRENGILLLVSAFVGAFGAALLSAGVGLNFGTFALVVVAGLYILQLSKHTQKDLIFGVIGIVIGVVIQLATPAKAPADSLTLFAGLAALLSLHV